jgi:ubiquitin C-terminal hydrolase
MISNEFRRFSEPCSNDSSMKHYCIINTSSYNIFNFLCTLGHYVCFVLRNSGKQWMKYNDLSVEDWRFADLQVKGTASVLLYTLDDE